MNHPIRTGLLLSATALALVAAPIVLNVTPVSNLSALAAGNGNGGSHGNSDHSNSGNNGGGNSDHGNSGSSASSSEHGNGGGKGHKSSGDAQPSSSKGGKGNGKKVADTEETATANGNSGKAKNLNAQLGGLNSLKRNINGVMNSSDPRMAQVREYIVASAALETANANLEQAQTDLATANEAYDTYAAGFGLTTYEDGQPYADLSLAALQDRVTVLEADVAADPSNTAAADELDALNAAIADITASDELAAVTDAEDAVAQYEADIAENEALTSDEALRAALLAAANRNRVAEAGGDAYLTPEIMAWATNVLGVGDANGLIDDYMAKQ